MSAAHDVALFLEAKSAFSLGEFCFVHTEKEPVWSEIGSKSNTMIPHPSRILPFPRLVDFEPVTGSLGALAHVQEAAACI